MGRADVPGAGGRLQAVLPGGRGAGRACPPPIHPLMRCDTVSRSHSVEWSSENHIHHMADFATSRRQLSLSTMSPKCFDGCGVIVPPSPGIGPTRRPTLVITSGVNGLDPAPVSVVVRRSLLASPASMITLHGRGIGHGTRTRGYGRDSGQRTI